MTQNANNKSFRCGEHGPWDRSEGGSDTTAKNIIERPNARRLLFFIAHYGRPSLFLLCQSLDGDGLRIEQWRIPFAESSLFFPGKWERSTGKYFGRRSVGRPVFLLHRIAEDGKKVMAGDGQRSGDGGLRYNPHRSFLESVSHWMCVGSGSQRWGNEGRKDRRVAAMAKVEDIGSNHCN